MASELDTCALIQADESVPMDLVYGLEPVISKLREYSGNPSLCLIVQRGRRPEYHITVSGSQAETTFTVAATENALDQVKKRLLRPVEVIEARQRVES